MAWAEGGRTNERSRIYLEDDFGGNIYLDKKKMNRNKRKGEKESREKDKKS